MASVFTHGIWEVKPGQADAFIAAWTDFASWSREHAAGAGWATLLRDRENPDRFFTFGPWDSIEAVAAWRALPGWQERVARIRPLLVSFQPSTLDVVTELTSERR